MATKSSERIFVGSCWDIFTLCDVKKSFGQVRALDGVSYTFPSSGLVFILGQSGSGKSTLLSILGLLDTCDNGTLLIDGKNARGFLEKERDAFRANSVGFVFQDFCLIEGLSVGQNVALPLKMGKDFDKGLVKNVLSKVGLSGFENKSPCKISGGQKQRAAIARALIKNPRVILADEPTGALDAKTAGEIFTLLQLLGKERLVIIVSHDTDAALRYGDWILELDGGKICHAQRGLGCRGEERYVVNSILPEHLPKYNSLLQQGKRLVFVQSKEPEPQERACPALVFTPTRLPIKKACAIGLQNIKLRLRRTLFTAVACALAFAFFGFADIISVFDANKLILREMENATHFDIGLECVFQDGVILEYSSSSFLSEDVDRLMQIAPQAAPLRALPQRINLIAPQNYSPHIDSIKGRQYLYPYVTAFYECHYPMGLQLQAGRFPQSVHEVAVTAYHMQVWQKYGFFEDELQLSSVHSFGQIEGRQIYLANGQSLTIVGLIKQDLQKYQPLLGVSRANEEHEELLRAFSYEHTRLSAVYTAYGFAQLLLQNTALQQLENTQLVYEDVAVEVDLRAIDIEPQQIYVTSQIAEQLFGTQQEQEILGQEVTLSAQYNAIQQDNASLDLVLVVAGLAEKNAVSTQLYTSFAQDYIIGFKIFEPPDAREKMFLQLLKAQKNKNGKTYKFFADTAGYYEIRMIDGYFSLFAGVFRGLSLVMCGFAAMLLYGFVSSSINMRMRDIGILRALGARKQDVATIFVFEAVVLALVQLLLGILLCYLGFDILQSYLIRYLGAIAKNRQIVFFTLRQPLLIGLMSAVCVSLSVFLPIFRITKKQPISAIKS